MELLLQTALPHQQKAIQNVISIFDAATFTENSESYKNPRFSISDDKLKDVLKSVQKDLHADEKTFTSAKDFLSVDVKMETGTGKTYVYTNLMYELHAHYGLNKFIIIVPSLPIKAGSKNFLTDPYTKRHFRNDCGYNCDIDVCILESKAKKKGKQFFPSAVEDFVKNDNAHTNRISVLLANMQLFTNTDMLTRKDYDYGVEGFYRPLDALKAVRPVLIIDEPHRFTREQKAWNVFVNELQPQSIIRFGATFPDITVGSGKNKVTKKDYMNLVYNLDACDSFRENLIKGVAKEHFEPLSKKNEKIKLSSVQNKDSANFIYSKLNENGKLAEKTFALKKGESLGEISDDLSDYVINGIGKNFVEFENNEIKNIGESFTTDVYAQSYQENMIRLSLIRHFEIERENFNRATKIKTLALYFIDDIASYRGENSKGEKSSAYLKDMFERILREETLKQIEKLSPFESDYKSFLENSLVDISTNHAGYFSKDNSSSDEAVAQEVQDILVNKKKLLSFKDENRNYIFRRFLFSKWTLKEGWDNPNVFTITKLRSSGSENSKIQEVGRGLRLPVDENGNRCSGVKQFTLNYIVDFTEEDFAQKLVDEINGEHGGKLYITKSEIQAAAEKRGVEYKILRRELDIGEYIDFDEEKEINGEISYPLIDAQYEAFCLNYPEFENVKNRKLQKGKIIDRNKAEKNNIRIKPKQYGEIKNLWLALNKKYAIIFNNDLNSLLENDLPSILKDDVFSNYITTSQRQKIEYKDGSMELHSSGDNIQQSIANKIPYNEFLKRASLRTQIPITVLHKSITEIANNLKSENKEFSNDFINAQSLERLCSKVRDWKNLHFDGRFQYKKISNKNENYSSLSKIDGSPKDFIACGMIGIQTEEGSTSENYLYDVIAYDSPLEAENVKSGGIDKVVVYGKIPRKSIAIPTIVGETYSPDFMYVVKKGASDELNLIIETKDVNTESDLRDVEKIKISCAEVFFEQLKADGIKAEFHHQLTNEKIRTLLDKVSS